ncbi:hypothetical protein EK21DRAFT_91940 [Setomelanomma holmii]|uniref:Heterokaryon incompatibility domain-containing protein n=1 Tax=Setomelanomma holmii TaxID=210430 RepID=A0A9P4LIU0_9PLEO|nr:hypothetical protein EK21DRAFT_91940 [Setomelanomma holmii]
MEDSTSADCLWPGSHPNPKHSSPEDFVRTSRSREQNLCPRCETLQLSSLVNRPWKIWKEKTGRDFRIATVVEQSLMATCCLCTQFAKLFKLNSARSGTFDGEGRAIELWCHQASKRQGRPTTYFSVAHPSSDDPLYLIPVQPRDMSGIHYGRYPLAPPSPPPPNFETITKWITKCRSEHLNYCQRSRGRGPEMLIDCQEHKLCRNINQPYACLNYVWGAQEPSYQAGGHELPEIMPQTVSDAMNVTLRVGLRYLWVDRYCIDQSDADTKHDAICNMDMICKHDSPYTKPTIQDTSPRSFNKTPLPQSRMYVSAATHTSMIMVNADFVPRLSTDQGAELTVIAASGDEPHHGLAGVSRVREPRVYVEVGKHIFAAVKSARQAITSSKWDTRAWTYQEALLSRRRLIFTESQIYFQCQTDGCLEGFETSEDLILWDWPGSRAASHFYGIPLFVRTSDSSGYDEARLVSEEYVSFHLGLTGEVDTISNSANQEHSQIHDNPFPSWTWAAVKAIRHNSDPGQLHFPYAYTSLGWKTETTVKLHVCHRSGIQMRFIDYLNHPDDYTKFEPWIDITSTVIRGSLSEDAAGRATFSTFPEAEMALHQCVRHISRRVYAVFIALNNLSKVLFILVEEISQPENPQRPAGEYRHIGVLRTTRKGVGGHWTSKWDRLSVIDRHQQGSRRTIRLV